MMLPEAVVVMVSELPDDDDDEAAGMISFDARATGADVTGAAVGSELAVRAGRCLAVDDFAILELALEVRRDEVPSTHVKTVLTCQSR